MRAPPKAAAPAAPKPRDQAETSPDDGANLLRQVVDGAIEAEVRGANVRVLMWLAARLKPVTPPTESTPGQELQTLLDGLSPAELREFESLRDPT